MSKFKIGQKAVCISSFEYLRSIWNFNYPKKGDIVTILSIRKHHTINDDLVSITGCECEICAQHFEPLKYDIIPNKDIIKDIIEERCDVVIKQSEQIKF